MITALILAATMPASLAPTSKWILDYEPNQCALSRRYGEVLMGLRWLPLAPGYSLIELDPSVKGAKPDSVPGFARIGASPPEAVQIDTVDIPERGRMTRVSVQGDPVRMLDTADAIRLVDAPGRSSYVVENGPAAARALRDCRQDWMRAKGIDKAIVAQVAKPAIAIREADWITEADYPSSAIRAEHQGTTIFLWTITAAGKAKDCRVIESSGDPELDKAACAAVMTRARYAAPAYDANGHPVESFGIRTAKWLLPR